MRRAGFSTDERAGAGPDGDLPAAGSLSDPLQCAFCGERAARILFTARDWEYGVAGEWSLARCDACEFYYQAPPPAPERIPSFYPPTYSAYDDDPAIAWLFRATFWLDARRVARLIGRRGTVLDVGCGAGAGLAAMRGYGEWELTGLELDHGAVRRARERGLDVRQGDLLSADFPPGSFNLIRMGHVIEHVLDPIATLRRAFDLLAPGGVVFGETPNIDCWDFRLFGRYWGALHFPRHLAFFTERTLRRAFRQVGFADVKIVSRLRTVGWSAGVQNWLADHSGLRVPAHGRVRWYLFLIVPFLPMTVLQALLSRSATVAFVARKGGAAAR
jgi:SAM-dependent methyltransferase